MLIRVVYKDYRFDFVKPYRLDQFLNEGRIAMFRRSSGWVFVGIDHIRAGETFSFYQGPERRNPEEQKNKIK